ncbi:hypothetical protein C5S53_06275 [Methanophagales archaeon]|nr:hypothetical protein C5S53_06275 [Methanophagales archaeon]
MPLDMQRQIIPHTLRAVALALRDILLSQNVVYAGNERYIKFSAVETNIKDVTNNYSYGERSR